MTEETAQAADGWQFACLEIMGFRKHYGRVREVEQFGAKMCRVDVPIKGNPAAHGWETHLYGASAIFGMQFTDEETVMRKNRPYEPPALEYFDYRERSRTVTDEPDDAPVEETVSASTGGDPCDETIEVLGARDEKPEMPF